MSIKHTLKDNSIDYLIEYIDSNDFSNLEPIKQVYGVCFTKQRLVLLGLSKHGKWGLLGGTLEKNESLLDCLKREVFEESCYRVLQSFPIGYQKVTPIDHGVYKESYFQVRFACLVEKVDEFIQDGDGQGSIIAIQEYQIEKVDQYWDWGQVSSILLEKTLKIYNKHWSD